MTEVTLFAGPSAHGLPRDLLTGNGVDLRHPARRGDIEQLIECEGEPGVIVLCDGIFQAEPAVSHAEICLALDRGWQVWGVSSLGAIRAFEMRTEGMRGFGYVYAQFSRFADFMDDELCLLHLPQPSYAPLTEALVNVRYALERQGPALGIGLASQRALIGGLRELWFGDRDTAKVREIMLGPAGIAPEAADRMLSWLNAHRIKSIDLSELLAQRPWQS